MSTSRVPASAGLAKLIVSCFKPPATWPTLGRRAAPAVTTGVGEN